MKKVFLRAAFVMVLLAGLASCSVKEKCPAYGHLQTENAPSNLG